MLALLLNPSLGMSGKIFWLSLQYLFNIYPDKADKYCKLSQNILPLRPKLGLLSFSGHLTTWQNYVTWLHSPSLARFSSTTHWNWAKTTPFDLPRSMEHILHWPVHSRQGSYFRDLGSGTGIIILTPKVLPEMGQGKKTLPEIQQAIMRLLRMLSHEQISTGLDVSTSTIQQVLAHFNEHGKIPSSKEECWESGISDSLIHFLISDSRSVYDLIFTLSILLTIIR